MITKNPRKSRGQSRPVNVSADVLDQITWPDDCRLQRTTRMLIAAACCILEQLNPMTLRQTFYQLVAKHVIANLMSEYKRLGCALRDARKMGIIPWEWMEDRTRKPRGPSMWSDLAAFMRTVRHSYRRDVWQTQPVYLEVWLEKEALAGIFEDILDPYGVQLNVGRGYDGWDSIHKAAMDPFLDKTETDAAILYFGDFDPSGQDMIRSLQERLAHQGATPEMVPCALRYEDIERYGLPPDVAKADDTRREKFIEQYGDVAVELDALPMDVLRQRIIEEVESRMDLDALAETKRVQETEQKRLEKWITKLSRD
jgi:hypothetical protein